MPSESVRRRKLAQNDAVGGAGDRPRRKPSGVIQRKVQQQNLLFSFICLLACVFLFIIFFGFYADVHPVIDRIATSLGYADKQYAVIIDAGSTGSRVLAYSFHKGYTDGRLFIDDETFHENKPGLSAYVNDPEEGANKINALLDVARNVIPKRAWPSTPLVLRATAGLRLLDPQKADNLLKSVRDMFKTTGFKVGDDCVEILDGNDEGVFSWFTINFLLGRLSSGKRTVAALDLGGGSTQVTFVPMDLDKNYKSLKAGLQTVSMTKGDIQVFTHSYLGLGLQAMRQAVFSAGQPEDSLDLESVCLNPIVENADWKYANKLHKVRGQLNANGKAEVDYEACRKVVREKALSKVKPKPLTLQNQPIAAFSYFFERAVETGMIQDQYMGEVKVGDYTNMARQVCAQANVDQKFMCTDLMYISLLLEEGYGLGAETAIRLFKKVDGHEISWALGCAYNILTK